MKLLKPILMSTSLLLLTACGGGDSTPDSTPASSTPTVKTVAEAQKNFQALGALSSIGEATGVQSTTNSSKSLQKAETIQCNKGGSVTQDLSDTNTVLNFSECTSGDTYINGKITIITSNNDTHFKLNFTNLTLKDPKTEMTSKSFTVEEDETEHWSTMDGDLKIISTCFSGSFIFETIAKVYEAQDGSDNAESGIIKLNGATYTFNNPYVTVKTANEEKTVLQSTLEKEMGSSTTCSE